MEKISICIGTELPVIENLRFEPLMIIGEFRRGICTIGLTPVALEKSKYPFISVVVASLALTRVQVVLGTLLLFQSVTRPVREVWANAVVVAARIRGRKTWRGNGVREKKEDWETKRPRKSEAMQCNTTGR
jgi:hypothetical protein